MMRFAASLPHLLLCALLAGCAGSPDSSSGPGGDDPILVTSPDDYSYLDGSDAASRPHLHDYWGKATTKTVIAIEDYQWHADVIRPGGFFRNGYFPEDGSVVPQGTGELTVEVAFTPAPGDRYGTPGLQYRSPAMAEDTTHPIPLDGSVVHIAVAVDEADLPHNALSGWLFYVGMQADSSGLGRFTGTMDLTIVAHRGRDIPLFPGHPDLWQGRSEIPLFAGEGTTSSQTGPSGSCTPLNPQMQCPTRWRPGDGTIVPSDASYIEVRLDVKLSARGLALAYHGADTRALTTLDPTEVAGTVQVYRIDVQANGDSPYAKQSLWEFLAVGKGDRFVENGQYAISASVFRDPPILPDSFVSEA